MARATSGSLANFCSASTAREPHVDVAVVINRVQQCVAAPARSGCAICLAVAHAAHACAGRLLLQHGERHQSGAGSPPVRVSCAIFGVAAAGLRQRSVRKDARAPAVPPPSRPAMTGRVGNHTTRRAAPACDATPFLPGMPPACPGIVPSRLGPASRPFLLSRFRALSTLHSTPLLPCGIRRSIPDAPPAFPARSYPGVPPGPPESALEFVRNS